MSGREIALMLLVLIGMTVLISVAGANLKHALRGNKSNDAKECMVFRNGYTVCMSR